MVDESAVLLDDFWREFRTGKCWPSTGEYLQGLIFIKPTKKDMSDIYLPEQEPELSYQNLPRSGSTYWLETIFPPPWFRHAMAEENMVCADPVEILKQSRKAWKKKRPMVKMVLRGKSPKKGF